MRVGISVPVADIPAQDLELISYIVWSASFDVPREKRQEYDDYLTSIHERLNNPDDPGRVKYAETVLAEVITESFQEEVKKIESVLDRGNIYDMDDTEVLRMSILFGGTIELLDPIKYSPEAAVMMNKLFDYTDELERVLDYRKHKRRETIQSLTQAAVAAGVLALTGAAVYAGTNQ